METPPATITAGWQYIEWIVQRNYCMANNNVSLILQLLSCQPGCFSQWMYVRNFLVNVISTKYTQRPTGSSSVNYFDILRYVCISRVKTGAYWSFYVWCHGDTNVEAHSLFMLPLSSVAGGHKFILSSLPNVVFLNILSEVNTLPVSCICYTFLHPLIIFLYVL